MVLLSPLEVKQIEAWLPWFNLRGTQVSLSDLCNWTERELRLRLGITMELLPIFDGGSTLSGTWFLLVGIFVSTIVELYAFSVARSPWNFSGK